MVRNPCMLPLFAATLASAVIHAQPLVVVELFTSEGCSSCPAADRVLAELTDDPRVAALGFHVDYWDRLGWPDALASQRFTQRQQDYGRVFRRDGVYTPQVVVNGAAQCVGSQRTTVHALVDAAASQATAPALAIEVKAVARALRVDVTNATPGQTFIVALVENHVVRPIGRGENSGRTLTHERAVRAMTSTPLTSASATVELTMPAALGSGDFDVVAFEQDPHTMHIARATQLLEIPHAP